MARPKSKEPTKDKQVSVRLTTEDYMKIKKVYGSIQKFLDLMVKALPILILVSCNGQQGATEAIKANGGEVQKQTTTIYAVAGWLQRSTDLAYKITYSCDDNECEISADLGSYYDDIQYNGTGYLSDFHFANQVIRRADSDFYMGQVCNDYNNCLEFRFNPVTKYAAVSDGTDCMLTYSNKYADKGQYDSFINSFRSDLTGTTYLKIWKESSRTPQTICGF